MNVKGKTSRLLMAQRLAPREEFVEAREKLSNIEIAQYFGFILSDVQKLVHQYGLPKRRISKKVPTTAVSVVVNESEVADRIVEMALIRLDSRIDRIMKVAIARALHDSAELLTTEKAEIDPLADRWVK